MEHVEIVTDAAKYTAEFTEVRRARNLRLGWATVCDDGETLCFPAIVYEAINRRGYTVYTVIDWQMPAEGIGDLADALDWAMLTATGTGTFINPRTGGRLDVRALDLPLDTKQAAVLRRWKTR